MASEQRTGRAVLVHGAYADGSSWAEVIPLLQQAGVLVISVQNPLTSLADDAAATRRALDLQDGPTVLVGHSWAGTVISEVGDHPNVSALVYVAARAPDGAQATLTYAFTDGSVVQEVTAYRLVDEGGVLKIAATTVLSSVGL